MLREVHKCSLPHVLLHRIVSSQGQWKLLKESKNNNDNNHSSNCRSSDISTYWFCFNCTNTLILTLAAIIANSPL